MVRQAPAGKYGDGGGLWLVKSDRDTGSWVLRLAVHGRLRHMGLGSIADVGLAEARVRAGEARKVLRDGSDPIKERERQKRDAARNMHLLKDVADDFFEGYKARLKGDGKAGRWFSPLTLHVLPKLGKVPVADLTQGDIKDALRPLRDTKPETMRKALNRLNLVVRHAAAHGLNVDLQAVAKAKALIGATQVEAENIPALPWVDVPGFYTSLGDGTVTHLALRLLILTGVRSGPLRFLHEDHVAGDVWTIPARLMKSRKDKAEDFRVPLSKEALAVIEQAKRHARGGFLFPSVRKGVISDATMARLMERREMKARPHGFRSSLRDWLAECTDAPHEVAETVLGHVAGNAVTKAYRRTDFIEQRRKLMERWASHVTGKGGAVLEIVKAAS
ncbi:integrase arm-type DNA-binding domain-containing protein [Mesorhizobium sp. M0984]|uniref:tyrosine-type recombinase/integrase n=1 Tax=Mesorhizobium sp. M0984 TaxID=2957041 RepID=UPI003339CC52